MFIDLENGEFYNVFGNEVLKYLLVCWVFIVLMIKKMYIELYKVFFLEIKEIFKLLYYINFKIECVMSFYFRRMIYEMLMNKRFIIYY